MASVTDLWVVLVGDIDIDYMDVYGPFTSEEAATAAADAFESEDEDLQARVSQVQNPDKIVNEAQEATQ